MRQQRCGNEVRLDGKVALVTGGSSGLGYETARVLAGRGARVIIASRDTGRAERARNRIRAEHPGADVVTGPLDLASASSVRRFARETLLRERRLDVLVNNAGAVGLPDAPTEDGLQLTMQVNYFGAFLLTYLLIPLMRSAAPSRIVNVSAATAYIGTVDVERMNDVGRRSAIELLADSKLALAVFTVELGRRLGDEVTANSVDPFLVADTEILTHMPPLVKLVGSLALKLVAKPRKVAAEELAYLASEPALNNVTGKHFKNCFQFFNPWQSSDASLRSRLWDASKRLMNVTAAEDWEL